MHSFARIIENSAALLIFLPKYPRHSPSFESFVGHFWYYPLKNMLSRRQVRRIKCHIQGLISAFGTAFHMHQVPVSEHEIALPPVLDVKYCRRMQFVVQWLCHHQNQD